MFDRIKKMRRDWHEASRLIGREKAMLDQNKVVVTRLFQNCFNPSDAATRTSTVLDAVSASLCLQDSFTLSSRLSRVVPVNQLSTADQDKYKSACDRRRDILQRDITNIEAESEKALHSKDPYAAYSLLIHDTTRDVIKGKLETQTLEESGFVELQPLGQLLAKRRIELSLYLATMLSVIKGETPQLVAFWKSVNALDDYSHLYPRHRGGGKRVRQPDAMPEPRPVFEPGLVPVPAAAR